MEKNVWNYLKINIILVLLQLTIVLSLYFSNQSFKLISDIFFGIAIGFIIIGFTKHILFRKQKMKIILNNEQLNSIEKEIANYYINFKKINNEKNAYIYYLKKYYWITSLTFLINIIFSFIVAAIFTFI